MTAIKDTTPTGIKTRNGADTDVEQQLDQLVTLFETIDWRQVDGFSMAEAATLAQKISNSAEGR